MVLLHQVVKWMYLGTGVLVVASHPRKCCLMKSVRPSQLPASKGSRGVGITFVIETLLILNLHSLRESGRPELTPGKAICSQYICTFPSLRNGQRQCTLEPAQTQSEKEKAGDKPKLLFRHLPLQVQHGPFSDSHYNRVQCGLR